MYEDISRRTFLETTLKAGAALTVVLSFPSLVQAGAETGVDLAVARSDTVQPEDQATWYN